MCMWWEGKVLTEGFLIGCPQLSRDIYKFPKLLSRGVPSILSSTDIDNYWKVL